MVLLALVPVTIWVHNNFFQLKTRLEMCYLTEIYNPSAKLITDSSLVLSSANVFVINTGKISPNGLPRQCRRAHRYVG